MNGLLRLVRASQPMRAIIIAAIAISIVDVAANLSFPVLTRNIIDELAASSATVFDGRVGLLLLIVAIGGIAAGISGYLLSYCSQRMSVRLKNYLFAAVVRKNMEFFDHSESGNLVSRIMTDTQAISLVFTKSLAGLISGLLLLVGSVVVLALLDAALTAAIFGIIVCAFIVMAPSFLKIAALTKEINKSRAEVSSSIARVLAGMRLVKALTAERVESQRVQSLLDRTYVDNLRFARVEALLTPVNGLALTGAMIAIFTYGAARVQLGEMTIGTLTIFILYIFNVVAPLIHISAFISQLQTARGSSFYLCQLLDAAAEPSAGAALGEATWGATGAIKLENIEFSYPGRTGVVLRIPKLEFPGESVTAIIGPSGAGKSTIVELLERFYEVDGGRILYDGQDIRSFDLEQWRGMIGYVSQDATLIGGTITENITYGVADEIDRERLHRAAEAANCIEFIDLLDQGFETLVGEAGVLLSAGQRQRIALARIFYRDPRILLLDEATANLDDANERAVLQSIARVVKGRTSIVIAHRGATVAFADRVVVLDRGEVSAILTPAEAMARRELFNNELDVQKGQPELGKEQSIPTRPRLSCPTAS